jgi:hypothetical protein
MAPVERSALLRKGAISQGVALGWYICPVWGMELTWLLSLGPCGPAA